MAKPAFKAPCRLHDNGYKKSQSDKNLPDFIVFTSWTPEAAIECAGWLIAAAEQAEAEGRTIRQYKKDRSYEEVIGFSTQHSLWKGDNWNEENKYNELSGAFSPLPIAPPVAPPAVASPSTAQAESQPNCPMPPSPQPDSTPGCPMTPPAAAAPTEMGQQATKEVPAQWNSAPLVPDDDEPLTWQTTTKEPATSGANSWG